MLLMLRRLFALRCHCYRCYAIDAMVSYATMLFMHFAAMIRRHVNANAAPRATCLRCGHVYLP